MIASPLGGRDVIAAALAVSLAFAFAAAHSPLLAIVAIIGIIAVSWIVSRAELVLLVLVAALPWEAMLQYPSPTLSLVKMVGVALAAAYVFRASRLGETVRMPATIVLALLFGMAVAVSLVASPDPGAGFAKAFRYAFFIGFLFLIAQIVSERKDAMHLLRVFCLSAAAAGLFGLLSFVAGDVGRAAGPIEDANDFGYLLATALPIAALLFIEDRRMRSLWAASAVVLLAATLATFSRGALVGLGALVVWLVLSRRISTTWVVSIGLGAIAVVALALTLWSPLINERLEEKNKISERNVSSRTAFWSAAQEMTYDNPVFGVGPARFGEEAPRYVRNNPIALSDPVVHNSYLEILAEDGLIALGLYLAMLASAWVAASRYEGARRAAEDPSGARLAAAIKGMLIVAIVSGIFLSEQVAPPIWLACALAASGALSTEPALRRARVELGAATA
ncbi:MAG: O-antigen ligase family protein [Solirubrobacterales bacterium]